MCAVTLLKTLDNEGQFTESLDCSLDHKDNLPPRDGRLCGPPGGAGGAGVSSLDCKLTKLYKLFNLNVLILS